MEDEPTSAAPALERGRESYRSHAWSDAHGYLAEADGDAPLEPDDLERLGIAAYLLGKEDESVDVLERGYRLLLDRGERARAAKCAFWLAFGLSGRGEAARAGGWLARGQHLVEDPELDCVERGYLLVLVGLQTQVGGDGAAAYKVFDQVAEIAERFDDVDLVTLSRLGRGQSLIDLGQNDEGVAYLDETMVAVTAGEVSPVIVGLVYCAVIDACQQVFDLGRAREWTAALSRWCESQPDMVSYRGQCLVHRAEILQLHGAWLDAMQAARRATERFSEPEGQPGLGDALFRQAELHRLRGELAHAEDAYRLAGRWGRETQPGLALLRVAQGEVSAGLAGIRRAVDEVHGRMQRPGLLVGYVEVALEAGDLPAARAAADELSATAGDGTPLLRALAAHATAAVQLAEHEYPEALAKARLAWSLWRDLEVPYEAARARVLVGLACRALQDEDAAQMELDAARWVFQQLLAALDVARVDALSGRVSARSDSGLTRREIDVLRLVAAGKTNRAIATELFLSEKTIARHVSNIFAKLGLSSRSAATAYAYQHQLV
ncbi:MAG: LuxR C-terminal-related transcriptional regulator [Nocardioidaceae bacterium]